MLASPMPSSRAKACWGESVVLPDLLNLLGHVVFSHDYPIYRLLNRGIISVRLGHIRHEFEKMIEKSSAIYQSKDRKRAIPVRSPSSMGNMLSAPSVAPGPLSVPSRGLVCGGGGGAWRLPCRDAPRGRPGRPRSCPRRSASGRGYRRRLPKPECGWRCGRETCGRG